MKINLSTDAPKDAKVDLLAFGVAGDKPLTDGVFAALDRALGGALRRLAEDERFDGGAGETLRVPVTGDAVQARWLLVVGLGKGKPTAAHGRRVAAAAVGAVREQKTLAVVPTAVSADGVRAVAEGLVMGGYRFDRFLTEEETSKGRSPLRSAAILVGDRKDAAMKGAVDDGVAVAEAINVARELVNLPPNELNAVTMAEQARQRSAEVGVKCTVLTKAQIERQRMNLLLAVNRGSENEPRVIHMVHKPTRAKGRVVFVGKGLTFDSGGLCLKPAKGMADMKCDMAGAAVTIATVLAAARLKLPVEVHGIVGATDNMTGGGAYRPGDIYTSRQGKTVEIVNTDAEGRLVLADVLSYAIELEPDYLVDHATLTGACIVALGPWRAGLYASDDDFGARYRRAAEEAGESFWPMPLDDELREMLKSDVADIKHTGEQYGGSITAALFLREFVGASRWIHCDIAGPAFQDRPHGLHPKGGTGFGVATAVRFLESLTR